MDAISAMILRLLALVVGAVPGVRTFGARCIQAVAPVLLDVCSVAERCSAQVRRRVYLASVLIVVCVAYCIDAFFAAPWQRARQLAFGAFLVCVDACSSLRQHKWTREDVMLLLTAIPAIDVVLMRLVKLIEWLAKNYLLVLLFLLARGVCDPSLALGRFVESILRHLGRSRRHAETRTRAALRAVLSTARAITRSAIPRRNTTMLFVPQVG